MEILSLTHEEVRQALPMRGAIAAMRVAFTELSAGRVTMPLRSRLPTDLGVTLLMPGHMHVQERAAVKFVSIYADNADRGLPTINSVLLVFDTSTGVPLALMDGGAMTALRTGAAGGLAVDLMARQESEVLAVFGAGVQAEAQIEAIMEVRPVKEIRIVSRSEGSAERLGVGLGRYTTLEEVRTDMSANDAVEGADIVVTATTSANPVFDGRRLSAGTHINGVGSYTAEMREIDEEAVRRSSRIIVDSREAAGSEAGDLILARAEVLGELGDILAGRVIGRSDNDEITLFKSVGVAIQDVAAANAALVNAERLGIGSLLTM